MAVFGEEAMCANDEVLVAIIKNPPDFPIGIVLPSAAPGNR